MTPPEPTPRVLYLFRAQWRHASSWQGTGEVTLANQFDRQGLRFDLDAPIPPTHLQRRPRTQSRRFTNRSRDHQPTCRIDGRFHGSFRTIDGTTEQQRLGAWGRGMGT
jgi:hypothetical protein